MRDAIASVLLRVMQLLVVNNPVVDLVVVVVVVMIVIVIVIVIALVVRWMLLEMQMK